MGTIHAPAVVIDVFIDFTKSEFLFTLSESQFRYSIVNYILTISNYILKSKSHINVVLFYDYIKTLNKLIIPIPWVVSDIKEYQGFIKLQFQCCYN